MQTTFTAELYLWDARKSDTWTFVTLPPDASEDIRELAAGPRRGFGSVRVRATIGTTSWTTSVFPDKGSGCYVLAVKAAVRKAEELATGDSVEVTVELIDL